MNGTSVRLSVSKQIEAYIINLGDQRESEEQFYILFEEGKIVNSSVSYTLKPIHICCKVWMGYRWKNSLPSKERVRCWVLY